MPFPPWPRCSITLQLSVVALPSETKMEALLPQVTVDKAALVTSELTLGVLPPFPGEQCMFPVD